MKGKLLNNIEKILQQDKLDAFLFEADENIQEDHLLVYLGTDYKEREVVLEITATRQEIAHEVLGIEPLADYYRMQFMFTYPFKVEPSAVKDAGSLLFFLNRLLELPGFELDEANRQISYKYVLLTSDAAIDRKVLLTIVSVSILFMRLYTQVIEQIATRETTLDDVLDQLLNLIKQFEA